MRAACAAAARVLQDLSTLVVPGVSTAGLDAAARGARDAGANGFSLYDLATTTPSGWAALSTWAAG